jgi:hypothetical protein
MDEKQLAKLMKKTMAKANKPKTPKRRTYDSTLDVTRPKDADQDNSDAAEIFEIMKKRDF